MKEQTRGTRHQRGQAVRASRENPLSIVGDNEMGATMTEIEGFEKKIAHVRIPRRTLLKMASAGMASAVAARPLFMSIGAAAQGTPGGTLNIGKPYELSGYDPHPEGNQTSWEIHAVVYESLIFLDDNLQPIPGLAESWEQPDDRTYVFKIRQGVTFHNGREMTADDVFYSLNRVLSLPAAWWDTKMGPPRIPDAAEQTAVAQGTPVAGYSVDLTIETTGPYEFKATTSEPFAPFLASLSGTDAAIVPGAELESGEFDITTQKIGTGPFHLTEHQLDTRWTFTKVEGYWREGLPMLDQLVWHVNTDEQARVTALRNGEIQITTFENPTMLDLVTGDANITAVDQPTTNYWILFQNGYQPELGDERVRQAVVLGIDRQQLVDVALFGRPADRSDFGGLPDDGAADERDSLPHPRRRARQAVARGRRLRRRAQAPAADHAGVDRVGANGRDHQVAARRGRDRNRDRPARPCHVRPGIHRRDSPQGAPHDLVVGRVQRSLHDPAGNGV